MITQLDEYTYKQDNKKILLFMLFELVAFVSVLAIFIFFFYQDWVNDGLGFSEASYLSLIIIFTAHFLYLSYKLINQSSFITVGEEGVLDNSRLLAFNQLVPWSSVQDICLDKRGGSLKLLIDVKDLDLFVKEFSWFKKMVCRYNRLKYGAPLVICVKLLEINHMKLYYRMKDLLRDSRLADGD